MALHTLQGTGLRAVFSDDGAELVRLTDILTEREYLWNGDATYWGRRSPVLFPIVGGLKNKEYKYKGNAYPMSQHGFARDRKFIMTEHDVEHITFSLTSDEESKKVYPFDFELKITYCLEGRALHVNWEVINTGKDAMHFSIGGHPAFLCPVKEGEKQTDNYILFDTKKDLTYSKLSKNGLVESEGHVLKTDGGVLRIDEHLFDEDALVIEGKQATCVSLADSKKQPYLTVKFDAPLFGLWSPAKRHAPFVCIEPWYGRCDKESFDGMLADREYGQELRPGKSFEAGYCIIPA